MTSPPTPPATGQPSAASTTVDVCIVTYRTADLVIRCLRSLWAEQVVASAAGIDLRMVVVDNDSGDAAAIEKAIADEDARRATRVIRAPRNGGFAYGNNLAMQAAYQGGAIPDYFWLLNPDTEVRPRSSVELVEFLKSRPSVGLAGSRLEGQDGRVWPYAFRFHTPLTEIDSGLKLGVLAKLLAEHVVLRKMGTEPEPVDWLPGASMMVRREVVDAIGGMDEGYFLYYEETDYCRRIKEAGYSVYYVPSSRVMHIAGASTGVNGSKEAPSRLPAYLFESRRRYFQKNFGLPLAVAADVILVSATCLGNLKHLVKGEAAQIVPHQIRDVLAHSVLLPKNRRISPAQSFHPRSTTTH